MARILEKIKAKIARRTVASILIWIATATIIAAAYYFSDDKGTLYERIFVFFSAPSILVAVYLWWTRAPQNKSDDTSRIAILQNNSPSAAYLEKIIAPSAPQPVDAFSLALKHIVDLSLYQAEHGEIEQKSETMRYHRVLEFVLRTGRALDSEIQQHFHITGYEVYELLHKMRKHGVVNKPYALNPHDVLITREQWDLMQFLAAEAFETRRRDILRSVADVEKIECLDGTDGAAFEQFCMDLLKANGFDLVKHMGGSGDQGVDIIAHRGGIKHAIQCKCYSSDLGNTPVQEVHAGKDYHKCHVGVVMTNQYFTAGAQKAAAATNVLLWDRDELVKMIKIAENTIMPVAELK